MPHAASSGRSPNGTGLRVLIVEDHPLMRRAMMELIGSQPGFQVCGEADSVNEALQTLKRENPHVVIVDLGLNRGHGIELIEQIRSQAEWTRILVVSAQDEQIYAERCLRAGAVGYLNKKKTADQLLDALRQVAAGEIYLSSNVSNQLLNSMVRGNREHSDPILALSNRELEVFEMIGRGLATKEIAAQLDLSSKTIETHRDNIKRKLDLQKSSDLMRRAVEWVLQNG
jgi:DNA-binding NarL/FixJ family response regulator